jgi:hypothetical protein
MTTKRQQTMAKITRERAVREKRERKLEKKRAAKAEKKARAELGLPPIGVDGEEDLTLEPGDLEPGDPASAALLDSHEPHGDDGPVAGERVVPGL